MAENEQNKTANVADVINDTNDTNDMDNADNTLNYDKNVTSKNTSALTFTVEERVMDIMSVMEECINYGELDNLIRNKPNITCYDGFEPSGRMHIAQGLLKTCLVNKLTKHGCKFKFWVADWFAKMNKKMDGDLKKIQTVGKYMIEIWKSCGMDMDNIEFLWASEEINKRSDVYWPLVMDIMETFNLTRLKRCCTILGRDDSDSNPASHIMYPAMQCADIFFLGADIAQLGMDQRKVNMLAREYCEKKKRDGTKAEKNRFRFKPVILSHHMLMGLLEGQEKMSKSNPNSAIFMEDSAVDVKKKIKKAFCKPNDVKTNPCIDYMEHIVFNLYSEIELKRTLQDEESRTYTNFSDFRKDYISGDIHPNDLKATLIFYINNALEPVRTHFAKDKFAKQLLKQVRKITNKK
jgi:tyrosyl-tRNA synthetase